MPMSEAVTVPRLTMMIDSLSLKAKGHWDVNVGCLLGGVCVRCIHRMPGEVIVGDSGLCCCGLAFIVICDVNCWSAITSHCLLIILHSVKKTQG